MNEEALNLVPLTIVLLLSIVVPGGMSPGMIAIIGVIRKIGAMMFGFPAPSFSLLQARQHLVPAAIGWNMPGMGGESGTHASAIDRESCRNACAGNLIAWTAES